MSNKNVVINFRCTEDYKFSLEKDAADLGMSLSQYLRFCVICKLNLEMSSPDVYNSVVDMTNYLDY